MRRLFLIIWSVVYPLLALVASPFWLIKMCRRGGWGSGLLERIGIYRRDAEFERSGGIDVHAVSVGEFLLALRLIDKWREMQPSDHFILVPTTATGMAIAREKAAADTRVVYAPLDLGFLVKRTFKRFDPRVVIMIESELWPNLIFRAHELGIPLGLVNSRLSPRSARRLTKARALVAPFFELLDHVGVPEEADLSRWQGLGVDAKVTVHTGNIKFDPEGAEVPKRRDEFTRILKQFPQTKIAIAASTFEGEEEYLADAFKEAGLLPVIVPRHAERRDEVRKAILGEVVLRSRFEKPGKEGVLVVDSTGELRDWIAHADVVVIGKSIFEKGGQNPTEAILAQVPVICGPHMANFEPLVSELSSAGGITFARDRVELMTALKDIPNSANAAMAVLEKHRGAMARTIEMF